MLLIALLHDANNSEQWWPPTFRTLCVKLLHGVVEADADRGEAHLSLEAGHQPVVQTPGALRAHHGGDGAEDAPVLYRHNPLHCPRLSLDLKQ